MMTEVRADHCLFCGEPLDHAEGRGWHYDDDQGRRRSMNFRTCRDEEQCRERRRRKAEREERG